MFWLFDIRVYFQHHLDHSRLGEQQQVHTKECIETDAVHQPGLYTYFDLSTEATSPDYAYSNRILGATSELLSAGAVMGCWNMLWICDGLGCKKSPYVATCLAILGGALQAGSAAVRMFLVARWSNGFLLVCPSNMQQLCPPNAEPIH